MSASNQQRLAKRMRLAARVIGLIAAGFLLIILIGEGISDGMDRGGEAIETAGILLGVLGGLALVGCIISWWRERLAGVLFLISRRLSRKTP